jgi:hypothetical protein
LAEDGRLGPGRCTADGYARINEAVESGLDSDMADGLTVMIVLQEPTITMQLKRLKRKQNFLATLVKLGRLELELVS